MLYILVMASQTLKILFKLFFVNNFKHFIMERAKLLNADWSKRRAFFLNKFPFTKGKITHF